MIIPSRLQWRGQRAIPGHCVRGRDATVPPAGRETRALDTHTHRARGEKSSASLACWRAGWRYAFSLGATAPWPPPDSAADTFPQLRPVERRATHRTERDFETLRCHWLTQHVNRNHLTGHLSRLPTHPTTPPLPAPEVPYLDLTLHPGLLSPPRCQPATPPPP